MIVTDRLLLRPMREDDTKALLTVFSDPLVMASFEEEPFDSTAMSRWVRRNLDHQIEHGYGPSSIIHRDSGVLIGDCGLEWMDFGAGRAAELGYDIRSDHWNRGLATEAATAIRDYAFRDLGLPRLVSLIRRGNMASRRVSEKVGMRLDQDLVLSGRQYWLYAIRNGASHPVE